MKQRLRSHIIWSQYFTYQYYIYITKTHLYNIDPLKPHFYIVKLGFTGVYIIFLSSAQNIDYGYLLEPPCRGGSNEYPQSMFWAEIWKISEFFIWEFSFFLVVKFSVYLNRHVFVMKYTAEADVQDMLLFFFCFFFFCLFVFYSLFHSPNGVNKVNVLKIDYFWEENHEEYFERSNQFCVGNKIDFFSFQNCLLFHASLVKMDNKFRHHYFFPVQIFRAFTAHIQYVEWSFCQIMSCPMKRDG